MPPAGERLERAGNGGFRQAAEFAGPTNKQKRGATHGRRQLHLEGVPDRMQIRGGGWRRLHSSLMTWLVSMPGKMNSFTCRQGREQRQCYEDMRTQVTSFVAAVRVAQARLHVT